MESLSFLEELEVLDLSNNHILDTQNIQGMPKLRELYLRNNRIKKFENFNDLPNLQILHLRNNNVCFTLSITLTYYCYTLIFIIINLKQT
jgi:Leucine-rich repeat (LRR) protein